MNANKGEWKQMAAAVSEKIQALAAISEEEGLITRTFGTAAFLQGSRMVAGWMTTAGLDVYTDNIGNVRGRLPSPRAGAKTLVLASHMDTVVNAGKFDGPLGILLMLEVIAQLIKSGQSQSIPFNIELIAFSDEEGVRFHTTYLGSKVVAGSFDDALADKKDAAGISLREVIAAIGSDITQLKNDSIPPSDWLGYFEVHIEQGPVLYEKDIPVALVTGIAGQKRAEVIFSGVAGHAGTVPMDMRQDALCAAAEFILRTEQYASQSKNSVLATVGKLHITHAASNTIPGEVICTLDLRSHDPGLLSTAYDSLQQACHEVCHRRGLAARWSLVQETAPVACNEAMNALLSRSIRDAGYEVVELVSGAGHDGVPISQVSPIAMLFVRCYKGISHHPLENVEPKDLAAAAEVSANFIHQLIKIHTR